LGVRVAVEDVEPAVGSKRDVVGAFETAEGKALA
jgi:hypothetical protein